MPSSISPFTARRLLAVGCAFILVFAFGAGASRARTTAHHACARQHCAAHKTDCRHPHRASKSNCRRSPASRVPKSGSATGSKRGTSTPPAKAPTTTTTIATTTVVTPPAPTTAPVHTTAATTVPATKTTPVHTTTSSPVKTTPTKTTTTATATTSTTTTTTTSTTATTSTTSAPSTGATSSDGPSSDGQVLFDPVYPSSGESTAVPATGWHSAQVPSDDGVPQNSRIQFTPAPGFPGDPNMPSGNVARFQLNPYYTSPGVAAGDVTDTSNYLANRAEIYGRYAGPHVPAAGWPDPVGSTRWYTFSVYLPVGFPTATTYQNWFDFTQWKGLYSGSPPVAMGIDGNQFILGGQNSDRNLGPITPGTWTHFVVGLNFADTATTGWATVYVNGSLVIDQQPTQTMNDATVDGVTGVDPDYVKMGIYRSKTWTLTQVLYLTPMVIGTTLDSVSPGSLPGSGQSPDGNVHRSAHRGRSHAGRPASANAHKRGGRRRQAVTSRRQHRQGRG